MPKNKKKKIKAIKCAKNVCKKIYILLLRFFLVFINNGTFIKVNKRIIFFGAIILLIELSGHGIFASLYRLLMSTN